MGKKNYSATLVKEIGASPSPIMFALHFSISRSYTAGTMKGNAAKLPV
jgi:hypothetical protein